VIVFLITGQFMSHHTPPMVTLSDSARLMFRSRHIYILAGGLVNLVLGVYLQRQVGGWRRVVQTAGSALLIASPALLVVAFIVEPARLPGGDTMEPRRSLRVIPRQYGPSCLRRC
jgi:hypothetical protein